MHISSTKHGIFGHWFYEVNKLEIRNFETHFFLIHATLNSKRKISTKPQNADFLFQLAANIFEYTGRNGLRLYSPFVWPSVFKITKMSYHQWSLTPGP